MTEKTFLRMHRVTSCDFKCKYLREKNFFFCENKTEYPSWSCSMRFRDCRGLGRCCELICSLLGRKVSVWDYMRGMYVQGVSGPYYSRLFVICYFEHVDVCLFHAPHAWLLAYGNVFVTFFIPSKPSKQQLLNTRVLLKEGIVVP